MWRQILASATCVVVVGCGSSNPPEAVPQARASANADGCPEAQTNPLLREQLDRLETQLKTRGANGDRLEVSREIDHSTFFGRPNDAAAAAADLESLGYRTQIHQRRLAVLHRSAIDERSARAFMCEVFGVVARHGGEYDGWGGSIVSK